MLSLKQSMYQEQLIIVPKIKNNLVQLIGNLIL
jgi:hypothetical protein